MSKKNLSYFMRQTDTGSIVTAPAPSSFVDENGNVVMMEIHKIPRKEIVKIENAYKRQEMVCDKKKNPIVANGKVVFKDTDDLDKRFNHIIVEALAYPNLKDPELREFYAKQSGTTADAVQLVDMPDLVFPDLADYKHVLNAVLTALGMKESQEDSEEDKLEIEDAKKQ